MLIYNNSLSLYHLPIRWMGLKWLVFLIKPLDLVGMWFGEDQRANITKTHTLKEIGLCLNILITALHSMMNTIERTIVSN